MSSGHMDLWRGGKQENTYAGERCNVALHAAADFSDRANS
jgi:hypothetical protein